MAKIKFDIAISEIKEQKNHEKIWRLRSANFPHILIDILGLDCNVALILCLDMSNWNFLPPMAKLLHPSLERLSHMNEVPVARESGRPHIFSNIYITILNDLAICPVIIPGILPSFVYLISSHLSIVWPL